MKRIHSKLIMVLFTLLEVLPQLLLALAAVITAPKHGSLVGAFVAGRNRTRVEGGVLPLGRVTAGVFYNPSQ